VQFSQEYIDYLRDSPVPVDLSVVAQLNSPMSLDVYWWLTRRYSYLYERQSITWQQLYNQFGSTNVMRNFKQSFQKAVDEVSYVYPQARITCGKNYVTIYPSPTDVPTTQQTRAKELKDRRDHERSVKASRKREISEVDIQRIIELIADDKDFLAVRRHVVHGLSDGISEETIVTEWKTGARF
jgi:hypothetical protein